LVVFGWFVLNRAGEGEGVSEAVGGNPPNHTKNKKDLSNEEKCGIIYTK
jgi:hypothetical protein